MPGVKGRSGGHNRKSIEEHKLDGTYIGVRHNSVLVPEDKRKRVEPQQHITEQNPIIDRDELFDYFADILHEQGMTQEVDSVLLSQLVEAQAMYMTALAYYKTDPEAVIGRKLASAIALDAAKEVRILLAEFRLTPGTRQTSTKKGEVEHDPVSAFMNATPVN